MTKEEIQLLHRILNRINPSEMRSTTAVYTSPAQQLRNRADELEQEEEDFHKLNDLINKYEK